MKIFIILIGCFAVTITAAAAEEPRYVPPVDNAAWARVAPAEAGFDTAALEAAIAFAVANETRLPAAVEAQGVSARDLGTFVPLRWAREPFSSPIGPFKARGAPTGLILKGGKIVAAWGEPARADMTFSVTKTFLSLVAGEAYEDGLLDPEARVSDVLDIPEFNDPHNAAITWDQLLRQTSGWWGTLWAKPAWADRPSGEEPWSDLAKGPPAPGAAYEYNDVRVNALALALAHLTGRPLPELARERILDPIGISQDFAWRGYENSMITVNGRRFESVSGGGHWGGGVVLTAYDQARLGLLALHGGAWGEVQVVDPAWLARARTPTDVEPGYGYMNFFLKSARFPNAMSDEAFAFLGAGVNMVYVDPPRDLVIVARWLDGGAMKEFLIRALAAHDD